MAYTTDRGLVINNGALWVIVQLATYTWTQVLALTGAVVGDKVVATDLGNAILTYNGVNWVSNTPIVLFKSAMPIINPPAGTMGNNGAITFNTAMPRIFPSCWVTLKANTIAAGSAAGTYYCEMSSTTVGIVYNNILSFTNGRLATPTKVAFATTGPGAYTTNASDADCFGNAMSIPGGLLGLNGALRVRALFDYSIVSNSFGIWYGGTQFKSVPTTSALSAGADVELQNMNNVAIQVMSDIAAPADAGFQGSTSTDYYTINTAVDQVFTIKDFIAGTAGSWGILDKFEVIFSAT
jgi:hypothetical protein